MRDLRLAIRDLVATPVVSLAASVSLALGIGATTAIFSVINELLLRPLPVDHPEQLVTISSDYAISYGFTAGAGWNYAMWDHLQQRAQTFDGALAWAPQRFDLSERGETEPVDGVFASGGFFSTLGVNSQVGRVFTPADDAPGVAPVVVISHGLWQRRFGGGNVIGTTLDVDRVPCTIVGVTPREFVGLEVGRTFDVALPLSAEPVIRGNASVLPQNFFLIVMLRLKAGQSVASATSTLRAMQPEMLASLRLPDGLKQPFTLVPAAAGTSGAAVGGAGLRQRYQRPLLTIFVVTALVLLVACMNIANLLLARAIARTYEMSVQVAIGAPRWRLARQLLVESLVLAAAGGSAGLLLAIWGSRMLVAQLSTPESRVLLNLSIDWRVAAFTLAVTGATVVLFGTAPACRASRADPITLLRRQPHSGSGDGRIGLSGMLVMGQIAFSMTLVVAAGLFVRSFDRLSNVPLGFDSDRVLVVNVNAARVPVDPAARTPLFHRLVDEVASLPGVDHAAASKWTPIAGGGPLPMRVDVPGTQNLSERERSSLVNVITPGWFATYGTAIRA